MRNNYIFFRKIGLLIFLIIFISCNPDDRTFIVDTNNTRTLADVQLDFSNINFNTGINDLLVESTFNNVFWNFRVIVPASASPTNKRPLIMSLHGGSSIIDPELHKNTACLVEPGFEAIEPIIIRPNSDGFIWYDLPNQNKVLTLIDLISSNLPVDQDKVVITGYSDGGNAAWYYTQNHPERFSASIPMASSYNPVRPDPNMPIGMSIPMYVIHGELDQLFPLATTQGYIDTTVAAGTDLEFVVAPLLDHYNSCSYVPYLQDAADWLVNTVWN